MPKTVTIPNDYIPRDYQLPVFKAIDNGKKRIIMRWSRRHGKDVSCLHLTAKKALERRGNYYHALPFYSQSRKAIWDGISKDGRRFIDWAFPPEIVENKNEQEMKIKLVNGSTWQLVGADNIDSIVGTNPAGIVFSEYSLMRPEVWDLLRPILAENEGWAVFQFTPRGRNHSYDLEQVALADPNNWFVSVVKADEAGVLSPVTLEQERREILAKNGDDSLYRQEYLVEYNSSIIGAYYGEAMERMEQEGRITNVPYDSAVPVHTVWDLGISDSTAIGFWQAVGAERRLIDYQEWNGKGLPDIIRELKAKPYVYGKHFAPHDIAVRELGTGKSRLETAKELGIEFAMTPNLPIADGINACRSFLGKVWADKEKGKEWTRLMPQYQRKYDDRTHSFADKPQHDWTSHGADMTRYTALNSDEMGNSIDTTLAEQRIKIQNFYDS